MIIKIDLTEKQLEYLKDEILQEISIDKLICELIGKLGMDNSEMDYSKTTILISSLSEYIKERRENGY